MAKNIQINEQELNDAVTAGIVSEETAKMIRSAAAQAQKRLEYNQRPDVKEKRAVYNKERQADIKAGLELLKAQHSL